jgi:plasmid stabilization system protein ParE
MAAWGGSRGPVTRTGEVTYFLSTEAERELAEAIAFYSERASTSVASAFLAEFARAARLLDANPGLGTPTSQGDASFPCIASHTLLSTAPTMKAFESLRSPIRVVAPDIGEDANEQPVVWRWQKRRVTLGSFTRA